MEKPIDVNSLKYVGAFCIGVMNCATLSTYIRNPIFQYDVNMGSELFAMFFTTEMFVLLLIHHFKC